MKAIIISVFLLFFGGYTLLFGYYALIGLTGSETKLTGAGYLHLFISAVITYFLLSFGGRLSGRAIVRDTKSTGD